MARMTDAEADALDEKWTKNPPRVCANGTGFLSKRRVSRMVTLDSVASAYVVAKSFKLHKTPSEIIDDLIERDMELAVAV
jgi:hypothetical protein